MEWGFFFFFFFFFYIETCFQTNVIICLCFNCSSCNTIANDNDMLVQILIHKLELILRKMIILLWFNSYLHLPVLFIWSDRLYIVYRYLTCHPILPGKFFCMVHLHVYKWSTFLYTFFFFFFCNQEVWTVPCLCQTYLWTEVSRRSQTLLTCQRQEK